MIYQTLIGNQNFFNETFYQILLENIIGFISTFRMHTTIVIPHESVAFTSHLYLLHLFKMVLLRFQLTIFKFCENFETALKSFAFTWPYATVQCSYLLVVSDYPVEFYQRFSVEQINLFTKRFTKVLSLSMYLGDNHK